MPHYTMVAPAVQPAARPHGPRHDPRRGKTRWTYLWALLQDRRGSVILSAGGGTPPRPWSSLDPAEQASIVATAVERVRGLPRPRRPDIYGALRLAGTAAGASLSRADCEAAALLVRDALLHAVAETPTPGLDLAPDGQPTPWRLLGDPLSAPVLADTAMASQSYVALDGGADATIAGLYVYQHGVYIRRGTDTLRQWIHDTVECEAEQRFFAARAQAIKDGNPATKATTIAAAAATKVREAETPALVETVVARVQTVRLQAADALLDRSCQYVNCANGLLDWRTGKLHPHTPDYLSATQIPVDYDPTVVSTTYLDFLKTILPAEEDQALWLEWMGYCLIPSTSMQKALLVVGSGANGKSTALEILTALVGGENVSAESLEDLATNRFRLSSLQDRLLNVCSDLPRGDRKNNSGDEGVFKKLVSGDVVSAERKNKPQFDFRPYARLCFSANQYPYTRDTSYAYWRRWIILPFEVTIPEAERDPTLTNRLTTPEELTGILTLAAEGLRHLMDRGRFSTTIATTRAMANYRSQADSVLAFLQPEEEQVVIDPSGRANRSDLYTRYKSWAEEDGWRPVGRTRLFAALAAVGYPQGRVGHTSVRVVDGLRLT